MVMNRFVSTTPYPTPISSRSSPGAGRCVTAFGAEVVNTSKPMEPWTEASTNSGNNGCPFVAVVGTLLLVAEVAWRIICAVLKKKPEI